MGKICQFVMGPAGAGKSTFCSTILSHCLSTKRPVHLINLDPAAEHFSYKPTIDIRDLITLEDVMDELSYGPNGGLIYCLEFLIQNMDWLESELDDYTDDYLIFDCPGQIELYTHFPIMRQLVDGMQRLGYKCCGVYLLDAQFVDDTSKFFSGVMSAMSAMIQLEIPHVNVMTKMDLLGERAHSLELERYLEVDSSLLLENANKSSPRYGNLNEAIVRLIDEFGMINLIPLNIKDEDSVEYVLSHIDNAVQYGEDLEPKEPTMNDDDYDQEWDGDHSNE